MNSLQDAFNFSGRTALVTGGSKGIGRSVVMGLAQLGAQVVYTCRKQDDSARSLQTWAQEAGYNVSNLICDSLDPHAYPSFFSRFQTISSALDILVNNVGDVLRRSSFLDSDDQLWQDTLNINLLSTVRMTKAMLPLLIQSDHAVIINVSSIAAKSSGAPDSLHYGVSKAALDTLTIGLAKELGEKGIRVVGVGPSAIDTDFQTRHSSESRLQKVVAQTPLGRIGLPDEVANTILFLASSAANYISGDTVMITGGR